MTFRVHQPLVDSDRYSDEAVISILGTHRVHVLHAFDPNNAIVSPMRVSDARLAEDGGLDINLEVGIGQSTRREVDRILAAFHITQAQYDDTEHRTRVSIGGVIEHSHPIAEGGRTILGFRLHEVCPAPQPMTPSSDVEAAVEPLPEPKRGDVRPSGLIIG